MTTTNSAPKKPAAVAASNVTQAPIVAVERSKEVALKAVETTREATDKVVSMSAEAVKEFWETGSKEIKNTQDKVIAFGRETSKTLSKSTDTVAKNFGEVVEIARENLEAVVESGNVAADFSRKLAEEGYGYANRTFASNMEHAKGLFSCRTLNDVVELQNKFFLANVDALFGQSVKLSDMLFKLATDVVEPVQTRVSQASEKISKTLAA